ncbi:MAG: hypothetical protein J6386_10305 [Candidatus Synoicihabitans palmerolidicus]|nr:hypothetical protein [Candidatus Synoicihabitans palmerolidicus]
MVAGNPLKKSAFLPPFHNQGKWDTLYLEVEDIARDEITVVPHRFDPSALVNGEVAAMSAYSTDELFLLGNEGGDYLTFMPRAWGIDLLRGYIIYDPKRSGDEPRTSGAVSGGVIARLALCVGAHGGDG